MAGVCAVVALLTGSIQDHGRILAMSLGFGVFSSTAGAGLALGADRGGPARALGVATAVVSAAAFGLLTYALWAREASWQPFAIAGLLSLWASHTCLVVRARRTADPAPVRLLSGASIVTLGADTVLGILAIVDALPSVAAESFARTVAALFVLTLLFTALPPLLRAITAR